LLLIVAMLAKAERALIINLPLTFYFKIAHVGGGGQKIKYYD